MIPARPTRDVMARAIAVVAGVLAGTGVIAVLPHAVDLTEERRLASVVPIADATHAFAQPVNPVSLSGMMAAQPDAPQRFLPASLRNGPTICDALAKAGFSNSGWIRSSIAGGRWECYATTQAPPGTASYSVFYMLRGTAGRIDEMRLKLTLRDAVADPALDAEVSNFLDALMASAHVGFPPTFLASVRSGGWATYVSPAATYSFAREAGDVPKWNLSVAFADPADVERAGAPLRLPLRAVRGPNPRSTGGAIVSEIVR